MFTCLGRYRKANGTITVENGVLSFSLKVDDPPTFNIGGSAYSVFENQDKQSSSVNIGGVTYITSGKKTEPSTFTIGGSTFSTSKSNYPEGPSEISIPVDAIFKMYIEAPEENASIDTEAVLATIVFPPAALVYAISKDHRSRLVVMVDTTIIPGNPRHEFETSDIGSLYDAVETEIHIVNKKAAQNYDENKVIYKETIREIVKIPCEYCGTLNEITKQNFEKCGAPIK